MTAFVSFDRVFEVLDTPNPITDRPGAVDLVDAARAASSSTTLVPLPAAERACRCASLEADTDRRR